MFHQSNSQLAAEHQPSRAIQVGPHTFRIHEHGVNQVGGFLQQIIHQGGGNPE